MNISKEKKKLEAVNRMKKFRLMPESIQAFANKNEVWLSEITGGLYEFSDNEVLNEKIQSIEDEYNLLVYHVIHSYTEFGELYNFLYVSDNEEEWEMDNEDVAEGYAVAYVWNITDEWCSEFGSIAIALRFGGLVRIG